MDNQITKCRRYSSLDEHPQKEQIVKDLIAQKSYGEIKKKYGLDSVRVLKTFVANRILYPTAQASKDQQESSREIIMGKLDSIQGYLVKLIDACDEWLQDPDRPGKYFMGDRATELSVIYTEEVEIGAGKTKTVRRRKNLQSMLDDISGSYKYSDTIVEYVQTSRTDTRKIMLESLRVAQQQVELIAKITGEMKEITMAVDVYGVVLPHVISVINRATDGSPAIQRKIYEGLAEISDIHDAQLEKGY